MSVLNRIMAVLGRAAAVVVAIAAATAGGTWAASRGVPTTQTTPGSTTTAVAASLVVPDVRNLAFVFAKSALEDAGFSWRVKGKVHGYPANTVVAQSLPPGARVVDRGAPLVVLQLQQTKGYAQTGQPEDASPYPASKAVPAGLAQG